MESLVLPRKTIIPTNIDESPEIYWRNPPPKLSNDAYLKRLCKLGRLGQAISALNSTVRHGTLSYLIESCVHSNSLELCCKIYTSIKKLIKQPDPYIDTKLVGMFAKCGSLGNALLVFDEMRERNLYTWSAIIGACAREKMWRDVVELFYSMIEEGDVFPDEFLFPKILQACGNQRDLETGRLIHGVVIKLGMTNQLRVNNSVLSVYAKCGCLSSAKRIFEGMVVKDRVSWNSMIKGCHLGGEISEAQRLFDLMQQQGVEPDVITWNILISSNSQLGKCDHALNLMNKMEMHGVEPDVFTWSCMISGFVQNNWGFEALKLFREMLLSGVEPSGITLVSIVSACSLVKDIRKGKEIHLIAIKLGYGEDALVGNPLIDMYSKCGKLEAAREVFDMILKKDVYTWNSMIAGYCQGGYCGVAHDLFEKMHDSGVFPNVITWNTMITGYIQKGDEDQAMDLFRNMEKKGGVKRDTSSWNALIAGYLHHLQKDKALGVFKKMQSLGIRPNSVTILSILPAIANIVSLKKVKEIHCCALRSGLETVVSVANSLIDTYAKSGNVDYASSIFKGMPSIDLITWNTLTTGYVLHGCFKEAIGLFELMKNRGFKPNRGTFANMISACALAKKVDEGEQFFSTMTEDYQFLPSVDHYLAMVNLYGRSGKLNEALDFIRGLPLAPDVSLWSAFLTACRMNGNAELAIHAGERLLDLEPDNAFIGRLVLQLYRLCGVSFKIRRRLERKVGTGHYIGNSWVEEKNTIRTFVSGDLGELDGKCVYSWIESIEKNMKASRYRDVVNIEEEEKEEHGGVHSEKLALAFAIIGRCRTSSTIRIVKNMRMCDNCHRFGKLVCAAYGCEIYVSDSTCLHHFKNGNCSCGDYW